MAKSHVRSVPWRCKGKGSRPCRIKDVRRHTVISLCVSPHKHAAPRDELPPNPLPVQNARLPLCKTLQTPHVILIAQCAAQNRRQPKRHTHILHQCPLMSKSNPARLRRFFRCSYKSHQSAKGIPSPTKTRGRRSTLARYSTHTYSNLH